MTLSAAFLVAVDTADEIVADGSADTLTTDQVRLAYLELDEPGTQDVWPLACCVALGAEYLATVGHPDDAEEIEALEDFAGDNGERNAAQAWAQYLESAS
jgi:hypothetical protein